jgi:hypothetical protein
MEKIFSLTYAQKAIWNIENFAANTSINNIAGTLRFKEELDFGLLEQGFNLMIKKTMPFGSVLRFKMENQYNMRLIINITH